MMFNFLWLTPLFNEVGEIGASSEQIDPSSVVTEGEKPSGDGNAPTPDQEDVTKQESFAKRLKESTEKTLAEERAKWEAEQAEKFKDYDTYKKATEFLQKQSKISDLMTLKEEIELSELQERAEKENVPASVIKRIDELEAKAAKAEELEAKISEAEKEQQQVKEWQEFEESLKTFCADKTIDGKPVDHKELWNYMHENEISKPEVAFKAMKVDILEPKLETARTDAVNEYLKSKTAPKTDGAQGAAGTQSVDTSKMSWRDLEKHAAERVRAARQPT